MVQIGPADVPSWAIIAAIGGGGFYLIFQGQLPASYQFQGTNLPIQDGLFALAAIGVAFGLLYQLQNMKQ